MITVTFNDGMKIISSTSINPFRFRIKTYLKVKEKKSGRRRSSAVVTKENSLERFKKNGKAGSV
tara:strand:+ start:276 stop:467 length:192 start_codon:yes stop_codon:yes gene_type:complete